MSERRDMSGILFKNTRKEKETHSDYQGECMIDGKSYFMNAWLKDGKNGKFLSFAFKAKEAPKEVQSGKQKPALPKQDPFAADGEIPF